MCTFLSISYKDVLIRVLLFTYFKLYFVHVVCTVHNGYLHIHILLLSQISQAPPPISHSYHCHLSFNSNHQHLINTQLSQHYLSTHLTSVSCPISLTRSELTPTLHSYLPQDCLLPLPRWSALSPMSACLRPSPQLIFGVGPRCVLNHVICEFLARKPSSVFPLTF